MYKYITHFSSTGNHKSINTLFEAMCNDFLTYFKPNFFKSVIIDNKTVAQSSYVITNGKLAFASTGKTFLGKQQKPNLYIDFMRKGNNPEDSHFSSMEAPKKYPGVYGYDMQGSNYIPIYKDPENINISTIDMFNRVDFNLTINVATRSDQEDMMNKIDNDIVQKVGKTLPWVHTFYIIPTPLIALIKDLYFLKEYNALREDVVTPWEEKKKIEAEINDKITAKLIAYSHINNYDKQSIDIYTDTIRTLDNPSGTFYKLNREIPLYFKFEKFEMGDGEKKNEVYEKFPIVCSGYLEFMNTTGYIMRFPEKVNGNTIEGLSLRSLESDSNGMYNVKTFHKYYVEERERNLIENVPSNFNEYKLLFEELDIKFSDSLDGEIDLRQWMKDEEDDYERENYEAFLLVYFNISDKMKQDCTYFEIHKDNKLLKPIIDYIIDYSKLKIFINNPDIESNYHLKLKVFEKKLITMYKVFNCNKTQNNIVKYI